MLLKGIKIESIICFLALLVSALILPQVSFAAEPAPEELVNRFLERNQLLAIEYFESNLSNLEKFVDCLEDASRCSHSNLEVSRGEEIIEIEFTQANLVEFIRARYSELRILGGIHSYTAVERGLALGRGRMSITPFHGSNAIIFDTRDEPGEREWQQIQDIYNGELQAIEFHNEQIHRNRFTFGEATTATMRDVVKAQMVALLQKFPFLKHMTRHNPGREEVLEAFSRLKRSYINTLTHIATLEGDDRFELFGFVATLQSAFSEFNDEEQALLEEHFEYIEETNTIWNQILDLVTSRYFLGMIGCWTASVFIPPVAAICGAIGVGFAVPGIYNLVQDGLRLGDFRATGEYDQGTYTRYMTGILLSGGMYLVMAQTAVPGLIRNVRSFHSRTTDVIQRVRLSPRTAFGTTRDILSGEVDVLWRSFLFNLKDFGSEGMVDLAAQQINGVSIRQLLPTIRRAFQTNLARIEARSPQIFLYSDVLRVSQTVLP